jgi:hypothetical protein
MSGTGSSFKKVTNSDMKMQDALFGKMQKAAKAKSSLLKEKASA